MQKKPLVLKLYNGPYEKGLVRRLKIEDYVIVNARTAGETYALLNLNPDAIIVDTALNSSLVLGNGGSIRCNGIEALIESATRPFPVPNRIAIVPPPQMTSYSRAHLYGTSFIRPENEAKARRFGKAVVAALKDRFKSFEREEVNPHLYILVGPSAAGKNTIIRGLSEATKGNVVLCPKYTTREPRSAEEPGTPEWQNFTEYCFVKPEMFEELCANVEEDILRYKLYKKDYGISLKLLLSMLESGRDVIIPTADLKLMRSLKEKVGRYPYNVVPILLHPPIELILYRLKKRIDERVLEQNREPEIRNIHAEHAKHITEFPYVFSYHLDKARSFEEMNGDEKTKFIERELRNVGNRLMWIHSHEKKLGDKKITVEEKHEHYVNGICDKLVSLSFKEVYERVRERGRIEIPICRGTYIVGAGSAHGRGMLVIEPPSQFDSNILYGVIGKIMLWLKNDENGERFFYDEQQDVRCYALPQRSSLMGLATVKDQNDNLVPIVDALFYTLTDCFHRNKEKIAEKDASPVDEKAAGLVLTFIAEKCEGPISIIPIPDVGLLKEQKFILKERSEHLQRIQPIIRRNLPLL